MTDPYQPEGSDQYWRGKTSPQGPYEPPTTGIPSHVDPAYADQVPMYPSGYPPQVPHPTAELPRQDWDIRQPPGGDPAGGGGPPEPPRFPNWLWLVAGAAVLLVIGMVIALVIANGSQRNSATVTPVTPLPTAPSVPVPPRTSTTTAPPRTSAPETTPSTPSTRPPTTSTTPGVPQTIVYRVTGTGKVLSIAYLDTGGLLKTDFNVTLPWSKEVTLTPPATTAAAVTVVNFGAQITCSLTVDGTQVRERTGSILTVCAAAG